MNACALPVVIPVHNETSLLPRVIADLIERLRSFCQPFELILVENGSTDDRPLKGGKFACLSYRTANYSQALRTGMLVSLGDVIVNFDVDHWNVALFRDASALAQHRLDIVNGSKNLSLASDRQSLTISV